MSLAIDGPTKIPAGGMAVGDPTERAAGEPATSPADLFQLVESIVTAAERLGSADFSALDAQTAVQLDYVLDEARKVISKTEDQVAEHAAAVWPGRWDVVLAVPGVGNARPYEKKPNKKWDNEALVAEVLDRRLAASGGELPDPAGIVGWITEAAAFSYWRNGVLEALGINPRDFVEFGESSGVRLAIFKPKADS